MTAHTIAAVIGLIALMATVTIEGTAGNAKAGAVVQTTNGGVVYVDRLDAWPKELNGKRVTATGELRTEKKIPDPRGPNGELRQGANGKQQVLHDARFGLAREDWRAAAGDFVTVRGTAGNAKAGAEVETAAGPCYVTGLDAWPKDVAGKPVSATGRLVRHFTPESNPPAAEIAGEWFSLEDARWSSP